MVGTSCRLRAVGPFEPTLDFLAALGLCGAVLVGNRGNLSPKAIPQSAPSALAQPAPEQPAAPVVQAPDAQAPTILPPQASSLQAVPPAVVVDKAKPVPAEKTVHVRLVTNPPDTKLTRNGAAVAGPPYEFDVPQGKRISVEASHKGYVTRKVTLDSIKTLVPVGLVLEKKHKP